MLVVSRRSGETIVIGNDIVVTVLEVRGGQVRIGVDAPRSITVHRAEVYDEVRAANRAAVEQAKGDAQRIREIPPSPKRPTSDVEDD